MTTPRLFLLPLLLLLLSSCSSGPNARTGTVIGGLGGAAVGGIIGNQSGRPLEGALIGGGIGALGGNVIGGAQDQRNRQRRYDRRYDDRRYDNRYDDRRYAQPQYYRRY